MYKNENIIRVAGNLAFIKIKNKDSFYETRFDLKFLKGVSKFHWRLSKKKNKFYVCTGQSKKGGKIIYLHNLIMGFTPDKKFEIDHKDGDSLNNLSYNPRKVTRYENIINVCPRSDSKTGVRGVAKSNKTGCYIVDFRNSGKRLYFKNFINLDEAVFIRYLCEITFLGKYRFEENDKIIKKHLTSLSSSRKVELRNYFESKGGVL